MQSLSVLHGAAVPKPGLMCCPSQDALYSAGVKVFSCLDGSLNSLTPDLTPIIQCYL